jgi:hypothetical protein
LGLKVGVVEFFGIQQPNVIWVDGEDTRKEDGMKGTIIFEAKVNILVY